MKKLILPFLLAAISASFAQTPCNNGFAGVYPCDKIDLQSRITLNDMNAGGGNDSWGWTDPDNGKEYAIMGLNNGTAFIDISDPINPEYLGKLPTHTSNSSWRDVKVYNNHAFVVSEAGGHGMQVFDLTRLRTVTNAPETFTEDAHYNGFGGAHNIVINEDTGFAYVVGASSFSGGPHFINIQDPLNPTAAGGFGTDDYSHDAQVVIYNGPDTEHVGKEIYIGSHGTFGGIDKISIVDVSDKNNPIPLATLTYTNTGYAHQGWFTEDQRYFILGDETDELGIGFKTRTIFMDLEDLDNPSVSFEHFGETDAVDHNGYVKGNEFYLANYRAGLRILDVSNAKIVAENITEVAYFDTYPENDIADTTGAWNVYPYFASGNIIISDISRGLFVVKATQQLGIDDLSFENGLSIYPNPSSDFVTIKSASETISSISISDVSGKILFSERNLDLIEKTINISNLASGLYFLNINGKTSKKIFKN